MLGNEEHTSTKFLSVLNATFTMKVSEAEGKERITKSGKKVYEKTFGSITGRITNVRKKVTEWEGKKIISWNVMIVDGEEAYVLSLNYGSNEARSFLCRLPNIDNEGDVTLNVFSSLGNDKKSRTFIAVFQYGKKVAPHYTKENLPPLEKIVYKGEERWDDTKQEAVFEKMVLELFPDKKPEETEQPVGQEANDDLPF